MYSPFPLRRYGGSRRGRLLVLLTAPALMVPLLVGATAPDPAAAAPDAVPATGQATRDGLKLDRPVTVTLVTGDKVTVQPEGGVSLEPGAGREDVTFMQSDGGLDRIRVMPSDAGRLVSEGRLDARLFDVSYLIKEGYHDAARADVPLLVDGSAAVVRSVAGASRAAGSAARVTREFAQVRMSAVAQDKKTATRLWAQLTGQAAAARISKGAARAVLPTGVQRVWLDAKAQVTLDGSVPQVGAPQAWQAGFDGTGSTVAVLDTGVDGTHPDLAGKVAAEENFTTGTSPVDGHGHGTHVASTIAGTGAASDGKYKGVAPGARVMSGKVLTDGGSGQTSWIVAGMEWAATNGADVVNMSLGCACDTPEIDPMEEAVNRLTAQTGALFVVSAGNSGPSAQTVGTPGSADAALTVAAVDKADHLADFSSRGPRIGDGAIKPDIAGPGVAIAAARASGTSMGTPVNDRYTTASGTSMAAPHVAGGAAILAQRHPDWTPAQLKATLMGSAKAVNGVGVFEVGTGRLDVHRAVTQQVHTSTPSVSFGLIEYPYDAPPATKTVSYRNDGTDPVTLNLAISASNEQGAPAPAGMFTLDTTTLTVSAGGTANATLTMNPGGATTGRYSGRLIATSSDGQSVQNALGVYFEPESYNLTVNLLDRNGKPPTANTAWPVAFSVHNHATSEQYELLAPGRTLRLPTGSYSVMGWITTARPDKADNRAQRLDDRADMAYPELKLLRDTTLTLDARQTRKIEMKTDRPTARLYSLQNRMAVYMPPELGRGTYYNYQHTSYSPLGTLGPDHYVGSVGASSDKFLHVVSSQLTEPVIRLDVNGKLGFPVDMFYADDHLRPRATLLGTHRMDVVHGGGGTPEELAAIDATGKLVVLDLPRQLNSQLLQRVSNVRAAGGRAVLLDRSPLDAANIDPSVTPELPILFAADPQRTRLVTLARAGDVSVTTRGVINSPYQYNLFLPTEGHVAAQQSYRPRDSELGVVEADYRFTGSLRQNSFRDVQYGGRGWCTCFFVLGPTADPERRTEYFSPGPVKWDRWTRGPAGQGPTQRTVPVAYKPGVQHRVTELAGVMGPSFATASPSRPAWAFRDGNAMHLQVPMFNDHGRGRYSQPGRFTTGFTRLYRDGQLIADNTFPGYTTREFTASPGSATYRLEARAVPPEWWQLSTDVTASWTFSSDTTAEPTALPLMAVRFKPTLDDYNRGPAGKKVQFPVWVEHQNAATQSRVTELMVEASFDDGQTWRPVQLRRNGANDGAWTATLTNPATGFVTLRATASDTNGNTVNQTIQRSYSVR